jgi:UDP-GlcNAc:undecaprenyl-phosphate GlcNAc-1-phosphate transferase
MHAARERDVHKEPTPLLGGFAIYGGLVFALLLASRLSGLNNVFTSSNMAKGLLLAGGLVVIMGFVDDRWGMGALSKLAGQVAAGVILVWSGAAIPWLPAPGGVTLALTGDQQVAVTILVVVVTMNAVNFIDGLDGLAAGIVGIGALAFFAYYFTLTHRLGLVDQAGPALVAVMLAGVCIGFLPHNFYPARIFMGDTGSMLIGLMLAYAPISSLALTAPSSFTDYAAGAVNRYGAFVPLLVPAAILLIPYADLLMAVVRRTRAGKSVFAPDKKHLQHRLLAIGHSHRTSVLIMYLWAALFSGTVILLSIVRTPLYILAIVTVVAVLALVLVTMPRLRPWSRAAGTQVPRRAGAAPAKAAPAPAASAPAAPARAVPARAPAGAATAGAATAGAATRGAATGGAVPAVPAAAGQEPARPAWSGVVKAPETARGNAARAAIRARLAESATASGIAGNGSTPGKGAAGNGDAPGKGAAGNGNGAAPAKDHKRQDPVADGAAGPGTGATAPEDGTGSPVTHAAGHSGWSWDAGDTLPPWAVGDGIPPWADDGAPPSPAGRSVPPWELAGPDVAGPDVAGPVPALPWPGQDDSAAVASEGPGNGPAVPPWPPAAPPRRPVTPPPWPPTAPPWP